MIRRQPPMATLGRLPRWTPTSYHLGRQLFRGVKFNTLRIEIIRPAAAERSGGYILAPTHVSHLEPFIISMVMRRHVDWMARIEFYRRWWARGFLNCAGAFPVKRQGVPVRAIRTAIARTQAGRVVGIFPEGGVATGAQSVCRGAPFKLGACLVAYRANVPILPCVVLGTHDLNRVVPWIPFRRARLWIAFGEPIWPDRNQSSRAARITMAASMSARYQKLCAELFSTFKLDDRMLL